MHLRAAGPVLIVGPGAVGTLLAARLAHAGTDVVLAARDEAGARSLRAGIEAVAPDGGTVRATPRVVARPEALGAGAPGARGGSPDAQVVPRLLVLATKCADAPAALATWLPALPEDAPVVALQNGVLGDPLKALAGPRFLECTVSFPATLAAPGRAVQTGPGGLHLGPWPRATARDEPKAVRAVAEVLAQAAPVRGTANMQGVKWTKLAANACITSLGVLTGQELGDLLREPRARAAFLAIVGEAHAAGRADGVRFEPVAGFRPGLFAAPLPGRDLLLRALGRKYRRHRSSSLQSLERGRRTEVDYLNGHVVATARRHGLAVPVNHAVVQAIHAIEEGRLAPAPDNLDLLAK